MPPTKPSIVLLGDIGERDFLPGHGGILDRIDSYIFTPSVLYYIFIIIKYLN